MADTAIVQRWTDWVLQHPLHRFANLELVHQEAGKAWTRFDITQPLTNMAGSLHAGVLYGLMDATCYLAVLPMLAADEHAATVDLHVNVIRSAPVGARVALRADVLRRGSTIAFVRCEAQTAEGGAGTIASGAITKSIRKVTRK